jgi:hypothetical protein
MVTARLMRVAGSAYLTKLKVSPFGELNSGFYVAYCLSEQHPAASEQGLRNALMAPALSSAAENKSPCRNRISLTQEDEVRYWTKLFSVSRERLAAAVAKVGFCPEAVAREFGKTARDR